MARYTFGGETHHIDVSEDATNVGTETTPRKALAINRSGGTWVLSATRGGTPTTDFMLRDPSTGAFTVPATSITVNTTTGFAPAFQGPDGVRVLYDPLGNALVAWEGSAAATASTTGTVTSVNGVAPDGGGNVTLALTVDYTTLPAGSGLTVYKASGVWPARPTARGDITVHWVGVAPGPTLVSSGTTGARIGVDFWDVLP